MAWEYVKNFYSANDAARLYSGVEKELQDVWYQGEVFVFGKSHKIPRKHCFLAVDCARDYTFSGVNNAAHRMQDYVTVMKIKRDIEARYPGIQLDAAHCNYYADGNNSIGEHSDNESVFDHERGIFSISLGASRKFRWRDPNSKAPADKHEQTLHSGDLMVMGAGFQKKYKHSVPKEKRVTQPRINITFRIFKK